MTYVDDVEHPERVDEETLEDGDDGDEGGVEEAEPADGLGVDDVQDVLGHVELDPAEELVDALVVLGALEHLPEQEGPVAKAMISTMS